MKKKIFIVTEEMSSSTKIEILENLNEVLFNCILVLFSHIRFIKEI